MKTFEKNNDLRIDASADTTSMPWVASPASGVERCILERQGGETAIRATSLVRFAKESYFPVHTHALGEEFFVLEGVFSDNTGDFPAGSYVRNPPGSSHSPHTQNGCTIFVKLEQFDAADAKHVVLDSSDATQWLEDGEVSRLALHQYESEEVELLRIPVGVALAGSSDQMGAEFFVVSGAIEIQGTAFGARSWIRRAGLFTQNIVATTDTLLYRKTGHLDRNKLSAPPSFS